LARNHITDKAIQIHVEPEQIGNASAHSVSVVGDQVMPVNLHEHGLKIDDWIDQQQEVKGMGLYRHLEGDACRHVARHDDHGSSRPRVLHKFHNFQEIRLHAPQCRLLQLAVAQSYVVGMVITQDTESVMRQVVRQGTGIRRGSAKAGSDDDNRSVGCKRLSQMVVDDRNRLAAWIPAFTWDTDHGRRL